MKIRHLELDEPSSNAEHDALALPPIEYEVIHAFERPVMRLLTFGVVGVLTGLVVYLMHRLFMGEHDQTGMALVQQTLRDPMFWTAVCVGLLAQAIDGALIGVYVLGQVDAAVVKPFVSAYL